MSQFNIDKLSLTASNKATLREFVACWGRHRYPVLFVGAGFSKFESERRRNISGKSKFGSWLDLLNDFQRGLTGGDTKLVGQLPTDPLRIAEVFQAQFGRAALLDLVAKHVPAADFVPGAAHRRLRDIPWAAIVTTNYDDLLERAFDPVRKVRSIVTDEDLTQHRTLDDIAIVKMHGDLARRDTIVIAEEDYRQYATTRPGISVKVRQLLVEHPLLFLGFSLVDPHFSTIDGWIRDTVGSVRLPAIAIVHNEALPAAHTMWKARGIELVRLGATDQLPHLLEAMAVEARPPSSNRQHTYNERVASLERDAEKIAKEGGATATQALADHLKRIVLGAKDDMDGGRAAQNAIRWFCWGWHNVLRTDGVSQAIPSVPSKGRFSVQEILDQLNEPERRRVLLFALEVGLDTVKLDGSNSINIADELLSADSSSDERALIHLFKARILRGIGRTADARGAIETARRLIPSKRLGTLLSSEIREVLFQEGDALQIQAELRSPLDEESDVLAMCRRGADSLLLGQTSLAARWYSDALDRATNGDEMYSALWGKLASTDEAEASGPEAREREEEEREKLRAISESQKPESVAADRPPREGRASIARWREPRIRNNQPALFSRGSTSFGLAP